MARRFSAATFLILAFIASLARAQDVFYSVALDKLTFNQGRVSVATQPSAQAGGFSLQSPAFFHGTGANAYAVLDGAGEIYVSQDADNPGITMVRVRAPQGMDVTGRLILPGVLDDGFGVLSFKIPGVASVDPTARTAFYEAKRLHYRELQSRGIPGAAWFRHQAGTADVEQGIKKDEPGTAPDSGKNSEDLFSLFSGGRAMAENLQLDRVLPELAGGPAEIEVDSIPSIGAAPIDWTPLVKGLHPRLDPLASLIPFDQHAIFFPTFSAMTRLADEADRNNVPMLQSRAGPLQGLGIRRQYEHQLGLSTRGLGRLLGPGVIQSAAITGGDPFWAMGSDVAIVFQPQNALVLRQLLLAQIALMAAQVDSGAVTSTATVDGIDYSATVSRDRSMCSYVARIGNAVVLTNSLAQIKRLAAVAAGKTASLASQPEYIYFRDRYKQGEEGETAFVILTDATIRRWCGPRWRIADSRRTRTAAVLSELKAANLGKLAAANLQSEAIHTDWPVPEMGDLSLTPAGPVSSNYGPLQFMTPISELNITKVTRAEADFYSRWKQGYEHNFRGFFNPTAIRFGLGDDRLAADLSVMPLIPGTQYSKLIDLTQGGKIQAGAGDPHDDLFHLVIALNSKSTLLHSAGDSISAMLPGIKIDPFSWLGKTAALYFDADPVWEELLKAGRPPASEDFFRMPVALRVESASGWRLAAFLLSVRGLVATTAPGMVQWDPQKYRDQSYVKLSPSPRAIAQNAELKDGAIYYTTTGGALLITPNLALMQRALDRQVARDAGKAADRQARTAASRSWLGDNIAARVDGKILGLINQGTQRQYVDQLRGLCWANLPILNEWKRLYPDQDPVKLHERLWGVRLSDPAGGQYVWNDTYQTMESTVLGCPAQPKNDPQVKMLPEDFGHGEFGLTFGNLGLRAKVVIDRAEKGN